MPFTPIKRTSCTAESSRELLQKETDALTKLGEWSYDAIHDALYALAEAEGIKIGKVMWPLRIAAAGKSVTPGGAIEIAMILGQRGNPAPAESGAFQAGGTAVTEVVAALIWNGDRFLILLSVPRTRQEACCGNLWVARWSRERRSSRR